MDGISSYLVCSPLLLLLAVIYLLLKKMTSLRKGFESYPRPADEKGIAAQRQHLHGDSPAYYTGDPSNDVLKIETLDLVPNPPIV